MFAYKEALPRNMSKYRTDIYVSVVSLCHIVITISILTKYQNRIHRLENKITIPG